MGVIKLLRCFRKVYKYLLFSGYMRLKSFGKTLAGLCLIAGMGGCISPRQNVLVNSADTKTRVEQSNKLSVEEVAERFNQYLCEANVPRKFVDELTIKFSSKLGKGETDYLPETKTILIHPDLKFINWYSMSGFSQQFGKHVLTNVFSEKEREKFCFLVDNYEQRAYPHFIGLDLMDSSKANENLQKCAFIDPLRYSGLSGGERKAEIIGYFYFNPYRETWKAIGEIKVNAINSGRDRFSSEFCDFFKNFGNKRAKERDVRFVVE